MKHAKTVLAAATAGLFLATQPAIADPKHCPPGHAKKGWCSPAKYGKSAGHRNDFDNRTRLDIEDALDDAYEQGYRDGRLRVGDRIDRDRYRILDRDVYYDRYGRRLSDDRYYVESDGERLLIDATTGLILDLLN